MTHTDALNLCLIELSSRGCMVCRREVGLFRDMRGFPRHVGTKGEADIQGIMPGGRGIAVEVKIGEDVQNPQQKKWMKRFMDTGGLFILARIVEKEDVKKILDLACI